VTGALSVPQNFSSNCLEQRPAGTRPELTGPESLTTAEQALAIGAALGKPVRFEAITPQMARAQAVPAGYPADLVEAPFDHTGQFTPQPVTDALYKITGRVPRSIRQWALAVAGFVVVSQVGDSDGLPIVITGTAMVFAGLMPVAALGMDVVVDAVALRRTGAASAISETTQELGFAFGIALLGSLGTAIYRRRMNGAIPPDSPAQAADAARDTLGGATGVADQFPAGLLVTAGQAYTDGLQAAAAASAVALAAAAAVAATLLRRTPTRSRQEPLTATLDDDLPLSPATGHLSPCLPQLWRPIEDGSSGRHCGP
jgi:hypothetical protein